MSAIRILESGATSFVVQDGRHELGTYSWGETWQHPHWHPLRTRRTGAVLTSRAPYDHPWHCGHWWAWKQIDDAICWNPPLHGENSSGIARVVATRLEGAAIIQAVVWQREQDGEELLREERAMHISVLDDDSWRIDWDIRCSSDHPRLLTATPWPEPSWGGYAGLSFRPARSLAFNEQVRSRSSAGGLLAGDACHGQPGRWLAYTGALDDVPLPRPPRAAPLGTVALMAHPENPVADEPWWATGTANLHSRFFCLGSGFLMGRSLNVQPGEPLRFRYRCVMSEGETAPERLDGWSFPATEPRSPQPRAQGSI